MFLISNELHPTFYENALQLLCQHLFITYESKKFPSINIHRIKAPLYVVFPFVKKKRSLQDTSRNENPTLGPFIEKLNVI